MRSGAASALDVGRVRGSLRLKLLFFLAGFFLLGALAWVVLLPSIVAATVREKTGFGVQVASLAVNPFTANLELRGLVLRNPPGWPVADFVELRRLSAEVSVLSLLTDRWVASEIVVDVAKVTLVKNGRGELNADVFRGGLATAGAPSSKRTFLIRHLVLRFDDLVDADYSGDRPAVKEYSLGIKRDLREVDSVAKIISPFAGTALGLVTKTMRGLFEGSSGRDGVPGAADTLRDAGKKTGETLKGLMRSLDKKKP